MGACRVRLLHCVDNNRFFRSRSTGDTFPASLGVLDLRCRRQQADHGFITSIVQELGRLCRYERDDRCHQLGYALISHDLCMRLKPHIPSDDKPLRSRQFINEARGIKIDSFMRKNYANLVSNERFASYVRKNMFVADDEALPHFFVRPQCFSFFVVPELHITVPNDLQSGEVV